MVTSELNFDQRYALIPFSNTQVIQINGKTIATHK